MFGARKTESIGNRRQPPQLGIIAYGFLRWYTGTGYGLWEGGPIPIKIGMTYGIPKMVKIGKRLSRTSCGQCAMSTRLLSFGIKSGWRAALSHPFNMMFGPFPCRKAGSQLLAGGPKNPKEPNSLREQGFGKWIITN